MSDILETALNPALRSRRVGGIPDLQGAPSSGFNAATYGPKDAPAPAAGTPMAPFPGSPWTPPGAAATPPPAAAAPDPYGLLTENSQLVDNTNPYVQQFLQRFGQTPGTWSAAEYQNQPLGGYVMGRGQPTFSGNSFGEFAQDPSRVLYFDKNGQPSATPTDDGFYIIEGANASGDKIKDMQSVDARTGQREHWQGGVRSAAELAALVAAAVFVGPEVFAALGTEGGATAVGAELIPELGASSLPTMLDGTPYLFAGEEALLPELLPALETANLPALADSFTTGIDETITNAFASTTPDSVLNPTLSDPFGGAGPLVPPMPNIPGGDSFLGGTWDYLKKNPLLPLAGVNAISALTRGTPEVPGGLKDLGRDTTQGNKPILDQARSIILNHGKPTGDQQSTIDAGVNQQIKEAEAAIKQSAANSGMGTDSMVTQQKISDMKLKAETLRQQLYMAQAQENIHNAIAEWGQANSQDLQVQGLIAQLEMQGNQASQQLSQSIGQSLAMLFALSNSRGKG